MAHHATEGIYNSSSDRYFNDLESCIDDAWDVDKKALDRNMLTDLYHCVEVKMTKYVDAKSLANEIIEDLYNRHPELSSQDDSFSELLSDQDVEDLVAHLTEWMEGVDLPLQEGNQDDPVTEDELEKEISEYLD